MSPTQMFLTVSTIQAIIGKSSYLHIAYLHLIFDLQVNIPYLRLRQTGFLFKTCTNRYCSSIKCTSRYLTKSSVQLQLKINSLKRGLNLTLCVKFSSQPQQTHLLHCWVMIKAAFKSALGIFQHWT